MLRSRLELLSWGGLLVVWHAVAFSAGWDRRLLIAYVEVLLPFGLIIPASRSVVGDDCLELLMTLPVRLRDYGLARLGLSISSAALSAAIALGIPIAWRATPTDISTLNLWLASGATCVFFAGVAYGVAAIFRSALAGGVVAAMIWSAAILLRSMAFSSSLSTALFPFLLSIDNGNPLWVLNKSILAIIGVAAILVGTAHVNRLEHTGDLLSRPLEED